MCRNSYSIGSREKAAGGVQMKTFGKWNGEKRMRVLVPEGKKNLIMSHPGPGVLSDIKQSSTAQCLFGHGREATVNNVICNMIPEAMRAKVRGSCVV